METVNVTINEKQYAVSKGSTVLQAAQANGIHIPTLCHFEGLDPRANCRMCVVEIEKFRTFQPACATKVSEGMVVRTDTPALRKARKTTLELILSDHAVDCHHCMRIGSSKCDDLDPKFCEMCFWCDCEKDGFCELQALAREYKVDLLPYAQRGFDHEIDDSTGSIVRNPNKCVKCRRCLDVCNNVQTVHNLCDMNRGTDTMIVPALGKSMANSPCVQCGRCVEVCPTGAIFAKEHKDELLYYTHKYGVTTVAQVSENIMPELARLSKTGSDKADMAHVTAGLRKIGVDYVVTDEYCQALSANAGENALKAALGKGTVIITDSLATQKFVEANFPELAKSLVSYPSTQQSFGAYVKDIFAKDKSLDLGKIKTINIVNDSENAAAAHETGSVDFSVNARELFRVFARTGADVTFSRPSNSDSFGTSPKCGCADFFAPFKWSVNCSVTEMTINLDGKTLKAAVTHTLGQTRELLETVRNGNNSYDVIRINA